MAESQTAEAVDPFNGEQPTLAEFNEYRQTGELPARFKPAVTAAEAAPAATSEGEKPESAAESEAATEETQEQQEPQRKGPQTAKERIAHLSATIEKLWEADE